MSNAPIPNWFDCEYVIVGGEVVRIEPRTRDQQKKEFRKLLDDTGVSIAWLAKSTGRSKGAFRRWLDGSAQPPEELWEWLEERADNPPPTFEPDPRKKKKNLP
jgi:hypothetical protein